jgi:2,5-dihydroxypyridine 5,6-dioxygenase
MRRTWTARDLASRLGPQPAGPLGCDRAQRRRTGAASRRRPLLAGNFLFSTGPNSQGGGKRTTKGHYDVPMRDCTVTLDNDVIIERGKFADEKMRVMRVAR